MFEHKKDGQQAGVKTEIAQPRGEKGFIARRTGGIALELKADQEVGASPMISHPIKNCR